MPFDISALRRLFQGLIPIHNALGSLWLGSVRPPPAAYAAMLKAFERQKNGLNRSTFDKGRIGLSLISVVFLLASNAHAETPAYDTPSGGPVPRWAMMSKSEVNARNGPSKDSRIVWTYHAVNLPVQIISETHDWRLICDPDGDVAWVSRGLLRNSKTVLSLTRQKLPMHEDPNEASPVKAILRGQALAQLDKCKKDWCRIKVGGVSGWVPQSSLWGTQEKAICQRPDPLAAQ